MTDALTIAQQAHADAEKAKRDWSIETRRLTDAAAEAVKAERRVEAIRLDAVVQAAYVAKREAENAAVKPHDLEGKRMVQTQRRKKNRYGGNGDENMVTVVLGYGVVETYRHGTVMPANAPWNLRNMRAGDAFVRLLKKDGKPGLKMVRLDSSWALDTVPTD